MKSLFPLLMLGWLGLNLMAGAQTKVSTEIDNVTVYRAGAMVERHAEAAIKPGRQIILLTDVPNGLAQETIKIEVPEGVRLMKTEYRYLTPEEMGFPDFKTLGDKIRAMDEELTAEKDLKLSLQEDLNFISINSDLGGDISVQELRSADAYISQRRREIRTSLRECIIRIEGLEKDMQALHAEFAQMETALEEPASVIEVELDCPRQTRGSFTVRYYVSQARWDPFYNVRSPSPAEPVSFEFMGSIRQNTGEDWDNIDLVLSTGNPSIGASEPDLPVWYVSYQQNYVPGRPYTIAPPNVLQLGSFTGLVIDQSTGRPLENARVELTSGNIKHIGVSDENGEVHIDGLRYGSFSFNCQYLGYNTLSSSLSIQPVPAVQRIKMSKNGQSAMLTFMPQNRNVQQLAASAPGVYSSDESVAYFREGISIERDDYAPAAERRSEILSTQEVSGNRMSQIVERSNFRRVEQASSTNYVIDKPFTVASDGSAQDVWINTNEVEAEYIYRMRPARSESAYLITRINNWEDIGLLKGTAHFFVEGTYNGSGLISPEITGDTLELALGIDPGITLDRERLDASVSRRFMSSRVDETFRYRIQVRNTKSAPVQIEIQEQFPISQHEDIEVSEKIAAGAEVDPDLGIITWKKTLTPNEEISLEYSFEITYPKDRGVNLPR